jgi:hypothetical protein
MGKRFGSWLALLTLLLISTVYCSTAQAVLKDFGPLNFGGYPAWYRDNNNLAVQQCLTRTVSPISGLPICALLAFPGTVPPFNPLLPVTFFPNPATNFNWPLETFYQSAQPPPSFKLLSPGAGRLVLLNNLEGSFANNINPVPGDQIVFSRVRIDLLGAPTGRYKITHPYGVDFMDVNQLDIKTQRFTRDIGLVGVRFTGALNGDIGPFLKWTPDPVLIALGQQNADGTIPATNPLTGAAEVYLGDPTLKHTFTGSPFGTNFWRIDGPPGSGIGGPGIDFIQSNEVILIGQKFTAPIPSPLTVDRATYARDGLTGQLDIFATTTPLSNVNTPSVLTVSDPNITTTTMTGNAAGNFYANVKTATPNLLPPTVTVTNTADVPPTIAIAHLVDEVTISKANYDLTSATLVVQASSADKLLNPTLTAVGLGPIDPATGTLTVPGLTDPPPTVTVQSSARGKATALVIARNNIPPIANNDTASTTSGVAVTINVIANDVDLDGFINPATVTIVTPPVNGTAVAHLDGTVTYTPGATFIGTSTFTYTVQDNLGAVSNVATVTVTVNAPHLPPVAANDTATTLVGTPVIINVIANDTAPGGFINPTSVSVVTAPANGTAIANPNGTVTYTPNAAFTGTNSFNYVVADNLGVLSNVALVTVTVNAANVLPVANNDTATTTSGLATIINVLANDTPAASLNPASVVIVTPPANGTAVPNPDGTVTYTSAPGFAGTNTFTYTVKDNLGTVSNAATVTVNVASNILPVANNDAAVTAAGVAVTINVLANDVASVGNTLSPATVTIVAAPPAIQGTATVGALTGAITFTPAAGFTGTSTFTYTVKDSLAAVSNVATVSVNVTAAPVAVNDVTTTPAGSAATINVLANDTAAAGNTLNPATVTIVTAPLATQGTATVNALTGAITFTPVAGFTGTSTFTYTVKDNLGTVSNVATVTVTVSTTSAAPVANNDAATTPAGTAATINVLANDTAVPGNTLTPATVIIVAAPLATQGTATVNALTGAVTFTPAVGFVGTSTFTYTVTDNLGLVSNAATVTVTVTAAPTAVNDATTTPAGTAATINVLANDTAAAGNTLNPATVTIVTAPLATQGTATVNALTGAITFTPAAGFTGPSTFTYTVKDNLGAVSNVATVTVTVSATSAAPVANNDAAATPAGTAVTINVLANDTAVPGNTLSAATVTIVAAPPATQGTATVNALTGAITFTPAVGFAGTSTFTYTVKDNLGAVSNAATVTVNVTAAPTAANDAATVPAGVAATINVLANDTAATGNTLNPATVAIVTPPLATQGTATVNVATGAITFTPALGFAGPTSTFTYTVKDNLGAVSNAATVTVTISVAATPVAGNDTVTTPAGVATIINVLANDVASAGNTLNPATVTVVTAPLATQGTATVDALTGAITFTPAAGFTGTSTFTYTVKDNAVVPATSNVATVTVNVTAAPTAVNDAITTPSGAAVPISVLANDAAAPGNTLSPATVTIVTPPLATQGTAVVNTATGVITFTPAVGFTGTSTFTYTVKDNLGAASNAATVTVTVSAASAGPVANNDAATTPAATAVTINVLANDTAVPGNTLNAATVTIVASPLATQGTATVNALTGAITFTPAAGFTGTSTFTYTVKDNLGVVSNAATVTVNVTAAPTAANDATTTPAGTVATINVLANDTAAAGNTLNPATVTIVTAPLATQGTATVNVATGAITFTPVLGFTGTSTFTYTVKDNLGAVSNVATVTVTVSATSAAPVANNDAATTPPATAATINVLANDTAVPGNTLNPATVTIVAAPLATQGTATVNALTGAITFTPAAGFAGTSTFTYTVKDNLGVVSNVATVTVNVTAAPTAVNDVATTPSGIAIAINVLANDTAAPGNTLNPATVTIVTPPLATQGTAAVNALTGIVTFTPVAGFTGTSTFTYTVKDNLGTVSNAATVTVTVSGTSAPPVANNDVATTTAGVAVNINVLFNDTAAPGNTLNLATVTIVTPPPATQGTTAVNALTGVITFTPSAGFTGTSSFIYTVKDNLLTVSNAATVTVTVNAAALPPVANNDTAAVVSGVATPINVLANDTAPSSTINPATVTVLTQPLNGTAVANATGIITYTSAAGFVGTNTFTYTVKDNLGATSNVATVTVTVNAPNVPPTANPDTATTTAGTAVTINVIANDVSPGGTINPTTVFIITQPLNGSAAAQPNGTVIYTPAAGFTGTNTFTYTVKDNVGAVSNTATVTVTVNPVVAVIPPTAVNDVASTNKNTPVTISVLANDSAAVGNTLVASSVFILTQPPGGTAAANATGTVTFTPALNFVGTTSFTYDVRDNLGTASNAATVTVTVLPVNIPPVALNITATMLSGVNANVVIPVAGFVSDVDGTVNLATVTVVTPPANGSVVVNPLTGAFTYTPNPGFVGVNTFTYTVQDNLGAVSNVATVTVTVNAPTAEVLTITRSLYRLALSGWRIDGTTTARVVGEQVFVYNSPTVPATANPTNGGPDALGSGFVSVTGIWFFAQRPGPLLNAPRQVSILTTLGNKLENIPMIVR